MDLTKIDKPFGELARTTQLALFAAWLDGKTIRVDGGEWDDDFDVGQPLWYPDFVYWVAPEPSTPDTLDWSALKDELICAARDDCGDVYAFTGEPSVNVTTWWADHVDFYEISGLKSYKPGNLPWDQSLIWRPGHEPKGG